MNFPGKKNIQKHEDFGSKGAPNQIPNIVYCYRKRESSQEEEVYYLIVKREKATKSTSSTIVNENESMVHPFLVEALKNPRHHLTILRMELDIQRFLQNPD
ncbi:hypothetical protein ACOSQ2_012920 [Xanthoceras sorbifolium]